MKDGETAKVWVLPGVPGLGTQVGSPRQGLCSSVRREAAVWPGAWLRGWTCCGVSTWRVWGQGTHPFYFRPQSHTMDSLPGNRLLDQC